MVRATLPRGNPSPTGLADVIQTILGKGLVIDAYIRVSWPAFRRAGAVGPAERVVGIWCPPGVGGCWAGGTSGA